VLEMLNPARASGIGTARRSSDPDSVHLMVQAKQARLSRTATAYLSPIRAFGRCADGAFDLQEIRRASGRRADGPRPTPCPGTASHPTGRPDGRLRFYIAAVRSPRANAGIAGPFASMASSAAAVVAGPYRRGCLQNRSAYFSLDPKSPQQSRAQQDARCTP